MSLTAGVETKVTFLAFEEGAIFNVANRKCLEG
jgi:hypothetical protein